VKPQRGTNRHDLRAIARRAMLERGLEPDFSREAQAELQKITGPAETNDESVRDMRALLWVSIDNDDSRDLDQLSVAEAAPKRAARVRVAIADVDALVERGSAIDEHARTNTTSVYTAGEIFPMLPTQLSTDLTSLNEDQERLAVVVDMVVSADGEVTDSEIYRAKVVNHAKLAYNAVAEWLEGQAPGQGRLATTPGVAQQLRLQDSVAQSLRRVRHRRGALTLETIEPRAVFTGDTISDLHVDAKNRAKELIEDLMIAANGVTARYLDGKGFPSLRRVLRAPERWDRIVAIAEGLGDTLPHDPDAAALEAFLERRREADPLRFPDLSLSIVKLLGRGEYALDPAGPGAPAHFGLAVQDYTHSTAPNRRYPDLLTQRLVKAAIAGQGVPYSEGDIDALAQHCTKKEDDANKVERRVRKSAAALLLESRVGEQFDAIVTGASVKGTWARALSLPVDGRIVRGESGLDVGERVLVRLIGTDVEQGFIDFEKV
jgi:VacB/RNase II family 3'-5' exoribonuclease